MKMTSKRLQKVDGSGQTTETIFTTESPKQAEETNRLVSLCRRLGYPFGNGLEDTLEPVRLDAPKELAPEEEISDGSNGFGRFGPVHHLLQNFVARRQRAAHDLQHTATVQLLEHFVRGQHGLRMLF